MVQVLPRIGTRQALLGSVASLVVLGLLAWWLWPSEEPPSGTITLMTGADRGVYQQYGNQLRSAIAEDMPGLRVDLEPSNGSQTNVRGVATGEADFAIAAADAVQTYIEEVGPAPTSCGAWRGCTTTTCSWSSPPTRPSRTSRS